LLYRFFLVFKESYPSANSAYYAAKEEALYTAGHQGSTGTIAETSLYLDTDLFFVSKEKAQGYLFSNPLTCSSKNTNIAFCLNYEKNNYVFYGWARCK
jgi:hypothetical protein